MIQPVAQSFDERVEMYMHSKDELQSMYDMRMTFPLDVDYPNADTIRQEYGYPPDMNVEQLANVLAKHDIWFYPLGCSENVK